jgi:hypothetical protein
VSEPAFYIPDGDGFHATAACRGPWSAQHQHAGPPSALVARAIMRAVDAEGEGAFHPSRITLELLRPIPITRMRVDVEIERRTKTTRLVRARLVVDDAAVARAQALLVREVPVALPPSLPLPPAPPPLPDRFAPATFPFFRDAVGYHTAMELRFAAGGFGQARSTAWMRMRQPLVAGDALSPIERVLCAADSTNGVTNVLGFDAYTFLNADLTVCLHRLPVGEWVCLDAVTIPQPSGVGLAESALFDERGAIGRAAQSLVVAARLS